MTASHSDTTSDNVNPTAQEAVGEASRDAVEAGTVDDQRGRHDLTGFSPKARAWRSFFETSAIISDRMEKRLHSSTGLRLTDYNLMLLLAEAEDNQLRMGELAEGMVFSPSRLSYQVKSLQKRGLIDRFADAEDRRGMTAQLTEEGHRVFEQASRLHATHIKQLFHPALDDAEADTLRQICEQIKDTVAAADRA
ncbi:MarR family transcriptional regulator [Nesterenkonia sp. LB17]|uniref:MarR family winged helix-turn-helix transcriptional regulator n=1 Tax=Nesterenkonia sp. LB17 TaxID=2901230 RepID=UPI001F4CA232|nr:MarR family transcriptional regulator [Nesterenkonia sp. LB17]